MITGCACISTRKYGIFSSAGVSTLKMNNSQATSMQQPSKSSDAVGFLSLDMCTLCTILKFTDVYGIQSLSSTCRAMHQCLASDDTHAWLMLFSFRFPSVRLCERYLRLPTDELRGQFANADTAALRNLSGNMRFRGLWQNSSASYRFAFTITIRTAHDVPLTYSVLE